MTTFVEENCGIFGLFGRTSCSRTIRDAIDFLQHRGQEYCGIATCDRGIHMVTHYGKVGSSFTDGELAYLEGTFGIGHVSLKERQPVRWLSRLGEIALAFSGNILNADLLMREMLDKGHAFYRPNHVEVLSRILMACDDPVTGLKVLSERCEGAYSLVLLTEDGIYAARDRFGFRPLILGEADGVYSVASESRAFHNLGMEVVRDVRPGEILRIDGAGFHSLKQLDSPRKAHCAFEWAYTGSIDSIIDGVWVQEARNRLGAKLAVRDRQEGDQGALSADLVAPVPMSGIGHAIGYHMESRIPYQEVYLYNRYADRSYTQSTQEARELMAGRKLSVLRHAVRGKRIILCDDSIVRGTQILNKVNELKRAGAREVHVRVACPPLMYPCDFGISTRSYEELLARRFLGTGNVVGLDSLRTLERWVADQVGADSVKYNSLEAFVAALGIPRGDLCLKCWDGARPTERKG